MSWISDEYQKLDRSPRALKRFGLMVGSVILILGCFFLWRQRWAGWPLISIGTVLVLAGGLAPLLLKWVYGPWMIGALMLGWVVTRVLLTLVFFLVVTPVGLLQRLFGKRVIEVEWKADAASYWQRRADRPVPADYEKQF
jgi:hypothetical protein